MVKIPLGRRQTLGIVADLKPATGPLPHLKTITALVDLRPYLTPAQLELARWVAEYYVTSLGLVIKAMLPKLSVRPPKLVIPDVPRTPAFALTDQQKAALKLIFTSPNPVTLLYGVTGSGKTEVYLQAIARVLKEGKQCLVLIPEISLTPQTIARFQARFDPAIIALLHSQLPYGQRFREWQRIRDGKAKIVIGPRSALFAPVQRLGLIVIDEEHESSYKQWDQQPRYHARDVARQYAKLTGARLILGSATPSIETFYAATRDQINLAELPERIVQAKMPPVEIVDMRDELRGGNKSIFSNLLQEKIATALAQKQQAILFINRRGAATFIMCRDCGYVPTCQRCQVSLTYHFTPGSMLLCHHCGYRADMPALCPACGSARIRYFGTGTQKVEAELKRLFPASRVLRLDTDTTQRACSHAEIFHGFAGQKADILIGTQMIAKGFDLPNVALVGIISADTSLQLPDFRSNERTFQLLTQVAGRTGRGLQPGSVVLQTYHPDHPTITAAAQHDYRKFYEAEIKERRQLKYPPFAEQIKIVLGDATPAKLAVKGKQVMAELTGRLPRTNVLGPIPAFVPKIRNKFIALILFSGPADKTVLRQLKIDGVIDVDPVDLLS